MKEETANIESKLQAIVTQVKNADINQALKHLDHLYRMLDAISGLLDQCQIQLPADWYEFYEAMLIKFRLNVRSIMELFALGESPNDNIIYHDLGSIYLLSRSLLENYLIFYYCFRLPATDEEAWMNYYIFIINGQVTHLSYRANDISADPDHLKWRVKKEQQLQRSCDKLKKLPCFQVLSLKEQREFLASKYAKRFSFLKLIELSPLEDILFADTWRLYSNYAHSEMVGLLQVNSYAADRKGHDNALYSTLAHALVLTAVMIKDLLMFYEGTAAEHVDMPELTDENFALVEYWNGMATTIGRASIG